MAILRINGQDHKLDIADDMPLLWAIRDIVGLTGTKFGCGEGQCLACTVLVNGKAVPSCLTPISSADKKEILTIEGLAKGDQLHPVQEAFVAEGASQCGYCTPGMIMGTIGLLNENPNIAAEDIPARMQRHLCRCGTYPRALKAITRGTAGATK